MKDDITLSNILEIYEKEISKNVKNKRKIYNFEINKFQNVSNVLRMLKEGDIGHQKYNIFLIYEPKCRLVMSLSVQDKIINHFVTRYVLEKKLTKCLDIRNVATRRNMGTDYGVKLVIKSLNELKKKYSNFYVLKIDISKYFYSIDHKVLKEMLINKLDENEFEVISKIINSTNEGYVNETIKRIISKNGVELPLYNYGKGLPIGNMTSQFLSIYYLNELDHYIVHNLRLKYYVRYMDDFIIMSEDLEKLKQVKLIVENKLWKEYKLKINKKKTQIVNIKNGFGFLGYTFKVRDNKTIIKIRKSNMDKIKNRIKKLKYDYKHKKIDEYKAFCSLMTYSYCYKYCDNIKVLKCIDRYWYEK